MFAYNEQSNIEASITSVYHNVDSRLHTFYILANGCSDATIPIAEKTINKSSFLWENKILETFFMLSTSFIEAPPNLNTLLIIFLEFEMTKLTIVLS